MDLFSLDTAFAELSQLAADAPWWLWAVATGFFICWLTAKPVRHAWRIRKADWVLKRIKELSSESGPAAQFGFLRSKAVDPFTFEEAILSALKNRKIKIKRNHRYTGDGGIDGTAWWNGKLILIQAKLYSGHITPKHVKEFDILCKKRRAHGLFVHSGKTGPGSWKHINQTLDIVSGGRLLKLLEGEPVTLFPNGLTILM
tara:strand:- start:13422 stop:14021 length:600 start_codon:yes stop_codon:yes gene_type:complete